MTTLSAGVIVVRREADAWRYLLLRAYANWGFPKGLLEPGEDALAAARREVAEETGIDALDFRWGYVYRETAPYGRGKVARYYLAATAQADVCLRVNPALGHPEHDEFRWASYTEVRALLAPRLHAILDWARGVIEGG